MSPRTRNARFTPTLMLGERRIGTRRGEPADLRDLVRLETRGADHRPGPRAAAEPEMLEGRLRGGELDENAAGREQRRGVGDERKPEGPGARNLAGITPESRVAGSLERAGHPEVRARRGPAQ